MARSVLRVSMEEKKQKHDGAQVQLSIGNELELEEDIVALDRRPRDVERDQHLRRLLRVGLALRDRQRPPSQPHMPGSAFVL